MLRPYRTAFVQRHHLFGKTIAVEVFHIHARWLRRRSVQTRVEAEVAHHKVGTTIAVEIARDDAIPPARGMLESAHGHALQLRPRVAKDGDRHPFANYDEIQAAVMIDVCPERVG